MQKQTQGNQHLPKARPLSTLACTSRHKHLEPINKIPKHPTSPKTMQPNTNFSYFVVPEQAVNTNRNETPHLNKQGRKNKRGNSWPRIICAHQQHKQSIMESIPTVSIHATTY
jgi:hypothetical protein